MKINIGSGYKRYNGFLNLDSDPLTKPDYVVDLERDVLPFEDSTISEVKASHILEHIGEGFFHLMKELYRVCKNNAIIDIEIPHHKSDLWFSDTSHVRQLSASALQQFSKKANLEHIEKHNSSSGFGLKLDVDFETISINYELYGNWQKRFKTMSQEECADAVNNYNNVILYVFIKLKVVKEER